MMYTDNHDAEIILNLDPELLNEVQDILGEIGIDMEIAIVMYLKEIARQKRIPFAFCEDVC